jgi:hypothetical protein
MKLFRQLLTFSMVLLVGVTSVACSSSQDARSSQAQQPAPTAAAPQTPATPQTPLADGQYTVQQVTYNDADGEYSAFLLNTSAGQPSIFRSLNVPLARLTDEEISQGKQSYLQIAQGQPSLHLTEDFKIEYVHNVTENAVNPQTGQTETIIVRQESNFWTPFAGALLGQAIGNALFTPQYYIPPVYQPGGVLVGYGGYGTSYDRAVQSYRTRHNAPPAEFRNRQAFRTSGQLRPRTVATPRRTPTTQAPVTTQSPTRTQQGNRSTGAGYGTNTLRRNNQPSGNTRPRGSFGTNTRPRSGGVRVRRR